MARHIWIVLLGAILAQASALECYDCKNVTDTNTCNRTVTCNPHESCSMEAVTLVSSERTYTLNCKDNNQCHQNSSSGPLIGRSVASQESSSTKRDAPPCRECCSTPLCNKVLCNHPKPSNCVDDPSVDCAKLDSIFNVCADIHKAKLVCPRFCNLCNVVDGNWNWWSSWSGCDVTCANGTQTRHRTCTDPAPQNGGLDCVGTGTESQTCIMDSCPIHGGWSQWSSWGSCSVTCDIGMQRRDRSCDNPYPTKGGDHCFGDSRDDRICLTTGCTDGHWSAWDDWSSCSASCGGGRKTRNRACTNPVQSLLGRYCDGPPQDVDVCNVASCTGLDILFVVGIPAMTTCLINAEYHRECRVKFGGYISRQNVQFHLQTASFTATIPGNYWFAWTFTMSGGCNRMYCNLKKNNSLMSSIAMDTNNTFKESGVLINMLNNDSVNLDKCVCSESAWDSYYPELDKGSTFTGILIH